MMAFLKKPIIARPLSREGEGTQSEDPRLCPFHHPFMQHGNIEDDLPDVFHLVIPSPDTSSILVERPAMPSVCCESPPSPPQRQATRLR